MERWCILLDSGIINFNDNGSRFITNCRPGRSHILARGHSRKKKLCECGHAKGFHLSANKPPAHGRTPCGFPECNYQAYKPKAQ
jgi:hypothetical protein